MALIKRDKYLDQLIRKIDNGMIKVITGLRRSGKSYLLNTIFYNYLINDKKIPSKNVIKFAFDSEKDLALIGENLLELKMANKKVDPHKFSEYLAKKISKNGHYFILLDEVQELEAFEYVLNGLLYQHNLDIYVTGSNAKFLTEDIITEFRGRGDEIHILPLSFSECWSFYSESKNKALDMYLNYGGLPLVVLSNNDEDRINYLNTQINQTYLSDIINRYGIRNTSQLDELFNILASYISGLVNPKKLAGAFKRKHDSGLTEDTIANYVKHFKDSFLIDISHRYNVKGKNYISTPYKIYFEDMGIRNARIGFRQVEYTHIMENVIYNELRYRGYLVDVGAVELRETIKDENGNDKQIKTFLEIDFVANKGSKRYYIQSAYKISDSEKNEKEIKSLNNTGDSFKKIVIVYDDIVSRQNEDGILYIGLLDFLSDPNSLER
ncbi:MAG: ATP-binding protein [Bacilli bacterium]|nr:ATP-binding protein [Bacilli bacterium]